MVFHGFVDDSGSGEGINRGNIFVLAGFIAKRWQQFSTKWIRICDRFPKTPDFKMQKAVRLLNEDGSAFWTAAQRDARIKTLVRLAKRKVQYRVESLVAWPNYDRVVRGRVPPEIDNPYFLCFYNVILSVATFMDKAKIEGTVDWVFDDQGRIGENASKWYGLVRASVNPPPRSRLLRLIAGIRKWW